MARIFDLNGFAMSAGMNGCSVSDEAFQAAQRRAKDLRQEVVLEDDDGTWLVHPDGNCIAFKWEGGE